MAKRADFVSESLATIGAIIGSLIGGTFMGRSITFDWSPRIRGCLMGRRWQFGEKRSLARLIGAMALVVATVLVLVPARPTSANAVEASVGAAASTSTPTGGLPTILSPQISLNPQAVLEIDEGDVVCGAGYVKINGQITPNLEGLTSAIGLLNVPNNWTVRSSWEVTTSGAGSQTLSLGFVDTPVVNPGMARNVARNSAQRPGSHGGRVVGRFV